MAKILSVALDHIVSLLPLVGTKGQGFNDMALLSINLE